LSSTTSPGERVGARNCSIDEEGIAGHGPIQDQWGDQAGTVETCDEDGGAPVAMGRGIDQAFALGAQP
jgi:hypothetical protein